jgi:hypothetical protein
VVPESLGGSFDLTRPGDGFTVTLQLPTTPGSFRPLHHEGHWWSFLAPGDGNNPEWAKITYVRVVLVFPRRIRPDEVLTSALAMNVCRVGDTPSGVCGGEGFWAHSRR